MGDRTSWNTIGNDAGVQLSIDLEVRARKCIETIKNVDTRADRSAEYYESVLRLALLALRLSRWSSCNTTGTPVSNLHVGQITKMELEFVATLSDSALQEGNNDADTPSSKDTASSTGIARLTQRIFDMIPSPSPGDKATDDVAPAHRVSPDQAAMDALTAEFCSIVSSLETRKSSDSAVSNMISPASEAQELLQAPEVSTSMEARHVLERAAAKVYPALSALLVSQPKSHIFRNLVTTGSGVMHAGDVHFGNSISSTRTQTGAVTNVYDGCHAGGNSVMHCGNVYSSVSYHPTLGQGEMPTSGEEDGGEE